MPNTTNLGLVSQENEDNKKIDCLDRKEFNVSIVHEQIFNGLKCSSSIMLFEILWGVFAKYKVQLDIDFKNNFNQLISPNSKPLDDQQWRALLTLPKDFTNFFVTYFNEFKDTDLLNSGSLDPFEVNRKTTRPNIDIIDEYSLFKYFVYVIIGKDIHCTDKEKYNETIIKLQDFDNLLWEMSF